MAAAEEHLGRATELLETAGLSKPAKEARATLRAIRKGMHVGR
jgi:hypothetical protein